MTKFKVGQEVWVIPLKKKYIIDLWYSIRGVNYYGLSGLGVSYIETELSPLRLMKYKLIHLDIGELLETTHISIVEEVREFYIKQKKVPSHLLVIVKGD